MTLKNIVIIGASGAIGSALVRHYAGHSHHHVFAFSRSTLDMPSDRISSGIIDFHEEDSIQTAAALLATHGGADVVIIATGLLHLDGIQPEKSIKRIDAHNMSQILFTNTIGPALVLKHFMPTMPRDKAYTIAALSARVGSISDNGLGGWYSYRASKAALNMILKTASIEASRLNERSIIVGLHPGTVDSELSKPFQSGVDEGKLFTPEYSAKKLTQVVRSLSPTDTGTLFAWDGQSVAY